VFSRAHVDDIAALIAASITRPAPCAIYNVVDDEPSPAHAVTAYGAELAGQRPPALVPFDEAGLSEEGRRFWQECRRVSNARAKAELGWRPAYPSYREGLAAILASSSVAATSR
jgi:nucleoside-diphosphate-sugar epimerase